MTLQLSAIPLHIGDVEKPFRSYLATSAGQRTEQQSHRIRIVDLRFQPAASKTQLCSKALLVAE
jgi:hypothetical protein